MDGGEPYDEDYLTVVEKFQLHIDKRIAELPIFCVTRFLDGVRIHSKTAPFSRKGEYLSIVGTCCLQARLDFDTEDRASIPGILSFSRLLDLIYLRCLDLNILGHRSELRIFAAHHDHFREMIYSESNTGFLADFEEWMQRADGRDSAYGKYLRVPPFMVLLPPPDDGKYLKVRLPAGLGLPKVKFIKMKGREPAAEDLECDVSYCSK